jgi:arylformamidase
MRDFFNGVLWMGILLSGPISSLTGEGGKTTHFYGIEESPKPEKQSLDWYAVETEKPAPLVVYVHGGGWQIGDKSRVQEKPGFFNGKGYHFVSANYRLLPEGRHPVNVEDVARALAWVHDHAAAMGADPGRIFLMGHSAGAHLVSLVSTDERYLEALGKDLSLIRGVVEIDTNGLDLALLLPNPPDLYLDVFGTDRDMWEDASPARHIEPGKNIPPFLLIVANRNPSKRFQARRFQERLKEAGIWSAILEADEKTHATANRDIGKAGDFYTEVIHRFLQAVDPAGNQG